MRRNCLDEISKLACKMANAEKDDNKFKEKAYLLSLVILNK